jgi:hypothetical protein
MSYIQYFSLIFLILKGNDFICIGLMLALFEGFPERLIAIIMRISTGLLVDGFCGN